MLQNLLATLGTTSVPIRPGDAAYAGTMTSRNIPLFIVWIVILVGLGLLGTGAWMAWGPGYQRDGWGALVNVVLGLACMGFGVWEVTQRGGREDPH